MKFNTEQQAAIDSLAPKLVVIAPPGSGKTATLVGAIKKHRETNPLDKICAITFTKKATAELALKLFEVPNIEISTIHGWSLKELNILSKQHNFVVDILDESEVKEILETIIKKRVYHRIFMPALMSFVNGNRDVNVSDNEKQRYRAILEDYVLFKRANQLYDFTDLPLYLYDTLVMYGETIKTVDALFVDEFQDVDKIQAQIFTVVDARKHFYIGDPDQSIYMFRGAEEGILDTLVDFERFGLNKNYRSYQNILDYATNLRETENFLEANVNEDSWIRCARTEDNGERGTIYRLVAGAKCEKLTRGLAAWEKAYVNAEQTVGFFMQKQPQILCRSNKQVTEIKKLGYENVSTVHMAKGLEYTNVVSTVFTIEETEQLNIAYVSVTRARDSLMVVDFTTFMAILERLLKNGTISFVQPKLF